jgi:hypothetical protein
MGVEKLGVNIEKINELIQNKFHGNQSKFAEEVGIQRVHLNKVIKSNGKGAGAIFCGAIINYCNENNIDYKEYIFLSQSVKKINRNEDKNEE